MKYFLVKEESHAPSVDNLWLILVLMFLWYHWKTADRELQWNYWSDDNLPVIRY